MKEENDEFYQYVLAKPVNQYYLLNILAHIIRGQTLCSEASTPQPLPEAELNPICEKGVNILLVDDNSFCRNALVRLLEKFNTHPVQCEDGRKALETFKATPERFDLLVTDYMMPYMDGIELIKKHNIIVLSGEEDKGVEDNAVKAGANVILHKPVKLEELDTILWDTKRASRKKKSQFSINKTTGKS